MTNLPGSSIISTVPTRIIAVANQKGGVGKTTTAINLAACLAESGRKILILDLDPQANADQRIRNREKPGASCYDALFGENPLQSFIIPSGVPNLDLIPSEMDLCGADVELAKTENHLYKLKSALAPIIESRKYDLILIDCAPSLSLLTLNALVVAEEVLVPLQCEYYALEGISMIKQVIEQIRDSGANPKLKFGGILMTMFDGRTKLSQQVLSEVREFFHELIYETVIPRTTRLAEAPSFGKPIIHYDPYSAGSAAYEVFAEEFSQRHMIAQS
ncbi:MAG: AAA family ATPase [Verrucomicrobia bacterium]|nr:AAA family ATPase [Verrucomicrobiota bacterium]